MIAARGWRRFSMMLGVSLGLDQLFFEVLDPVSGERHHPALTDADDYSWPSSVSISSATSNSQSSSLPSISATWLRVNTWLTLCKREADILASEFKRTCEEASGLDGFRMELASKKGCPF